MNDDLSNLTERQRKGWEIINGLGEQMEKIFDEMIGEPVWRSADGRVSPISKMDNNHLRNSINMLERRGEGNTLKCEQLKAEWNKRHPRNLGVQAMNTGPSKKQLRKAGKKELYERLHDMCLRGASFGDVEEEASKELALSPSTVRYIVNKIRQNFEMGVYE